MAYTMRCERDETGWWAVEVPEVQGCRTQARTLREARRRIRDALALFVDDAETADLVDDIRLPTEARRAIDRMTAARRRAEEKAKYAADSASAAARVLTERMGISVRDAAEVLGVSFQRVHQLAHANGRGR